MDCSPEHHLIDDAHDRGVDGEVLGFFREAGARSLHTEDDFALPRSYGVNSDERAPGGLEIGLIRLRSLAKVRR